MNLECDEVELPQISTKDSKRIFGDGNSRGIVVRLCAYLEEYDDEYFQRKSERIRNAEWAYGRLTFTIN